MNAKDIRRHLIFGALVACAAGRIAAADATFSSDGQRVYLVKFEASKLTVIDIPSRTASELDLGSFTGKQAIRAVSLSSTGDLLFVTARDAWDYNFEKKSCTKLCAAKKGSEFEDLAYDPKSGGILIPVDENREKNQHGAVYLQRGNSQPHRVFMRRVDRFDGIGFSADGELFFGARGDLWVGRIDLDEPDQFSGTFTRGVLVGRRCAPLATLETALGTQGQIGVEEVAVAGQKLYVHLQRMGGSGWGNIVRLNKPAVAGEDSLEKRLDLYTKEAASVEVLGKNGTRSYLCASPDGKKVFFASDEHGLRALQFFLVEDDGKPVGFDVKFFK